MTDYNIQVKLDTNQAQSATDDLEAKLVEVAEVAAKAGAQAGVEVGKAMARAEESARKSLDSINRNLEQTARLVKQAFAFVGVGLGLRELARMGDTITQVKNQMRDLTSSSQQLDRVMGELFGVARRSRTEFASVGDLFDNLSKATKEYGLTTRQVLTLTENFSKVVSGEGKSIQEVAGTVRSLSVAFSTGAVNAGNIRRILGQFPEVADVVAESLGKTRQELFQMAEQGKITGKTLIDAFLSSTKAIEESFGQKVPTIAQALTGIQTAFEEFLYKADASTGVLGGVAKALEFVADNMTEIITVAGVLASAFVALKVVTAVTAAFNLLTAAVTALSRAMLFLARNPIVLIATALTAIALSSDKVRAALAELFNDIAKATGLDQVLGEVSSGMDELGTSALVAGDNGERAFDKFLDSSRDARAAINGATSATGDLIDATSGVTGATRSWDSSLSGVASGYDQVADAARRAADAAAAAAAQQDYYRNRYGGGGSSDYENYLYGETLNNPENYFETADFSSDSFVRRARGGPVDAGQMALVGEHGPELIMAKEGSIVLPHSITQQLLAQGVPGFAQGGVVGRGRGYVDYAGGGGGRRLPPGYSGGGRNSPIVAGEKGTELIIDPNALTIGLTNSYESFQNVFQDAARLIQFNFKKEEEDPVTRAVRTVTGGDLRRGGRDRKKDRKKDQFGTNYGPGGVVQGSGDDLQNFLDKHPGEFVTHILAHYGGINSIGPLTFENQLLRLVATGLTQEDIADPTIIAHKYRGQHGLFNAGEAALQAAAGKYTIKDRRLYVWDQWVSRRFEDELAAIPVGARIDSSAVGTIGTGGWASNPKGIRGTHFSHPALGSKGFNEFTPDRSHFPDLESTDPIIAPNGELSYLKAADGAEWRLVGYDRGNVPRYEWSGGYISVEDYEKLEPRLIRNRYGTGGQFRVGGSGPVDSQLVQFMASPGETVTVSKPGDGSRPGEKSVRVEMHIHGVRDAESFRRSKTQVTAEMVSEFRRVERRMP